MKSGISLPVVWSVLGIAQLPMLGLYLWQLQKDPIYGLIPCVLLFAAALLIGLRWNRQWEAPNSWLSLGLLAVGLSCALLSSVLYSGWLAAAGWLCCCGGFLNSHHQRDGQSLYPVWFLIWGILRWPLGIGESFTLNMTQQISQSVEKLLRLFEVPHINFNNAVEVAHATYYFDLVTYSLVSWPLFVGIAMLHSAIRRRTTAVAALNLLSALFWFYAYHCATLAWSIKWHFPTETWQFAAVRLIAGLCVYGLFISIERGFRSLLYPISDRSLSSRILNPFVEAWNWCFQPARIHGGVPGVMRLPLRPVIITFVCLAMSTLLLQIIRTPLAVAALRKQSHFQVDAGKLRQQVFSDAQSVEYRHTYYEAPVLLGQEADVWIVHAPLLTTKHVVLSQLTTPTSTQFLLDQQGWTIDAVNSVTVKLPGGESLTYQNIDARQQNREMKLYSTWLGPSGTPIAPPAQSLTESVSGQSLLDDRAPTARERGHWIVSHAPLVKPYRRATEKVLLAEFSRVIVAIRAQLSSTQL